MQSIRPVNGWLRDGGLEVGSHEKFGGLYLIPTISKKSVVKCKGNSFRGPAGMFH